jgi:hypothetical protein
VGEAFLERLLAGLDDVARRVEVRLADLQVDDLASGGLDGLGAGQHLEGGLGAEPGHAVGEGDSCHGPMIGRGHPGR